MAIGEFLFVVLDKPVFATSENRCAVRTDHLTVWTVRRPFRWSQWGDFFVEDKKEGSPFAPCKGAFFFGTAKKGESVTFVKVTKHLP